MSFRSSNIVVLHASTPEGIRSTLCGIPHASLVIRQSHEDSKGRIFWHLRVGKWPSMYHILESGKKSKRTYVACPVCCDHQEFKTRIMQHELIS